MSRVPIIPLEPNRVWRTYQGGKTLDEWEGAEEPSDSHYPEDWIGSTTAANNVGREEMADEGLATVILDGIPRTLASIVADDPVFYFGNAHANTYGSDPRFLLKYLDSAIRLHIQVHPTVAFSRKHLHADYGKTEGYYILGARTGAPKPVIYIGFSEDIAPEALRKWIAEQRHDEILSRMHEIAVGEGDCFVIPGGVPHAIGADLFMMEVMEPSDFAVRFEFERGGYILPEPARFMGRDIEFGISMTDLRGSSYDDIVRRCRVEPTQRDSSGSLTHDWIFDRSVTDKFSLRRFSGIGRTNVEIDSYGIAVVCRGRCTLSSRDTAVPMNAHDRCVIAAAARYLDIETTEKSEILIFGPPDC